MPYFIAPLLLLAAQVTVSPAEIAPSAAVVARLPDCVAGSLSFDTDGQNGSFAGMQKDGTLLVVRNLGPAPCKLVGLPVLTLKDRRGRVLPIRRTPPIGMHPGPVVLPVGLAVGAEATTPVTWIQGAVFARNTCFDAAYATITVAGVVSQIRFAAHICGRNGSAGFNQPPLRTDPTL